MLPKYIWLIFFVSALYMLYSSTLLQKYILEIYKQNVEFLYNTNLHEEWSNDKGEILFTSSALRKYNNLNDGLYLAILGQVFDVSKGAKHYGPGESYHSFTGCDGSAAFITGDFTENGLTDDVSTLTNKQIRSLINWIEFYRKTYTYKGKLIGRYYNKDGSSTDERSKLEERVQMAVRADSNEEQNKIKFPPCNIEWNANTGTRVWCSKNSGGIARNWIGVPRMLYNNPELHEYRCACIRLESRDYEENKGIVRTYKGCEENSSTCIVTNS